MVRSPGRINLIGEHTDYNDGFVLPAAIDREIYLAIAARPGRHCPLYAADLNDSFTADLGELQPTSRGWPNYLLGVVDQFQRRGFAVPGFACLFGGNIPIGAGLSSSAALEGALAFSLNRLFAFGLSPLELAKIGQLAEHRFAGVQCGIMDQFANHFGRVGSAIKLDCRALDYVYYPLPRKDVRVLLCDTTVRRALAASEYNRRRQQCEEGVAVLQRRGEAVRSLRDATTPMLQRHRAHFEDVVWRRCSYVVAENNRVEAACDDLQRGDLTAFGQRMLASHAGLRDEYEVSCPELDFLVEAATTLPGVLGSRMMGAGFGGCTINLVEAAHIDAVIAHMREQYQRHCGLELPCHLCNFADGTGEVTPAST